MSENYLGENVNDKYYPRLSCALSSEYDIYQCCHHDCELPDNEHDNDYEWKIEHRCSCCKSSEAEKPKGEIEQHRFINCICRII